MSLYLNLKDELLRSIVEGKYEIGEPLPTEQELGEQYGLSRVTVRKALDELKKDGLLQGVPRTGTIVTRRRGGFNGSMDLIALVAEIQDVFFLAFMEHFEQAAEDNGSLMLFKQDFQGKALRSEQLFLRLIQKNIRNVVIWPQTDDIDYALLGRLQAVGMNFVFFDQQLDTEIGDIVGLDHYQAVAQLYADMAARFAGPIIFIGYSGLTLSSEVLREQAYLDAGGRRERLYTLPWREPIDGAMEALFDQLAAELPEGCGIICNSGGVGLAAAQQLRRRGLEGRWPLATVDYMPEHDAYPLTAYEQPMKEMAEQVYRRLAAQNNEGPHWRPGRYLLQGRLVRCGARD